MVNFNLTNKIKLNHPKHFQIASILLSNRNPTVPCCSSITLIYVTQKNPKHLIYIKKKKNPLESKT